MVCSFSGKAGKGCKVPPHKFIDVAWLLSLFHINTWSVVQQSEVCSIALGTPKGGSNCSNALLQELKVRGLFDFLVSFAMLLVVSIGTGFLRGVAVWGL